MRIKNLFEKLKGIQTIETIKDIMDTDRQKAIYFIHQLKKKGYVKTKRLSDNKRMYTISFENRFGGTSYYEIINKYSPLKIAIPKIYKVYGKELDLESTLIYAIKTEGLRTILASLALFKKIDDWDRLYRLAKKNHIERQVGVLYDIARKVMLTRKMTKRFRNNSLPKDNRPWIYIIPGIKSDDFKDTEKIWKIYVPFNKRDLEVYKT